MKQSLLFTKTLKEAPKDEVSTNAQLLIRAGFVNKLFAGVYSYLPLGLAVLQNIERIIREEMNKAGAEEVLLPALHPRDIWDTTGRWETVDVLFKLNGSGEKEYALGATHEEVVTPLAQAYLSSYKQLPRAVYQIQTKFRNEPRAKSGILRGREFRMKDLYSFHVSQADLDAYYERMIAAYTEVFRRVGLGDNTYMVYASGGAFSKYSHEFQTVTEAGEDHIYLCGSCRVGVNKEILGEMNSACPKCGSKNLEEKKAIEVGNIFKLGTRFSDAFKFKVADETGALEPVVMGCYGIGSSRLLGAVVEALHDSAGMVWPVEIAPFKVHLVSLCNSELATKADALYKSLNDAGVSVLYDDRAETRAGEKFADSDLIGLPLRIVISPKTLEKGMLEVKKRTDKESRLVSADTILNEIQSL